LSAGQGAILCGDSDSWFTSVSFKLQRPNLPLLMCL
jgi:hypothetical protein